MKNNEKSTEVKKTVSTTNKANTVEKTTTKTTAKKTTAKTSDSKSTTAKSTAAKAADDKKETASKAASANKSATTKTSSKTTTAKTTATKSTAAKTSAAKSTAAKTTATKSTTAKTTATKSTSKKAAAKTPIEQFLDKMEDKITTENKVEEKKVETKKAEVKPEVKKTEEKKVETKKAEEKPKVKKTETKKVEEKKVEKKAEVIETPVIVEEKAAEPVVDLGPRRSVCFIGSECYPFVKTGGLGDVMYALPKALAKINCDVKVILPRYKCIPQEYQDKMVYKGDFYMDLCMDGKQYYVGIMEYVWDGVVYDFIDNEEFFSYGNPYTNLVDDIPKFCFFGKAALAALNYMNWTPDVIHCHDWQAGLVPLYLREMFQNTPVANSSVILTIHNLRFQGIYNIETIKYWSNLPDHVFNKDVMTQNYLDANMLKGGLTYCNKITTVSDTYAGEIQSIWYGEGLDAHLRYHNHKLCGIVNGIDYDIWNPATDKMLSVNYDSSKVIAQKKKNKKALQEALGLEVNDDKIVIGLISRLTNQKGLDLVNQIVPSMMDGNTQLVVLGSGDSWYENTFRYYENEYKGSVCAYIAYNEALSHQIYAGCDALLVPSQFEPCGLTQLIGMHYGSIPIVRETGGLKDTVEPYNTFENRGNGFTFDRYEAGLLDDAINRAKTLYFTDRTRWDEMVVRNMEKDVSWERSAKLYKNLYVELAPRY